MLKKNAPLPLSVSPSAFPSADTWLLWQEKEAGAVFPSTAPNPAPSPQPGCAADLGDSREGTCCEARCVTMQVPLV